ncbi:hypothetical protein EK21DRAFT_95451 [Setomelanomma holmii]|uniref:Uncharacterized protein n=1 Tax=Setomelanomma holmii TaxID=210430 RepID=A0A9P4GWH0_9PLEO|nr:hypothetical protein EK21DRAFT_95451 [Setomelanomma holmii]
MPRRSSDVSNDVSSGLPFPPPAPPRKPRSPYVSGTTFLARRHDPPTPFGGRCSQHSSSGLDQLQGSSQLEWCLRKLDVTAQADSDYVDEVAAYTEFQGSTFCGNIVPDFFGSRTIDLETVMEDEQAVREVRLILVKYVPGVCMLDLDPGEIFTEERETSCANSSTLIMTSVTPMRNMKIYRHGALSYPRRLL